MFVITLGAALLGACGGGGNSADHADSALSCALETRDDDFSIGLEKDDGDFKFMLMAADPAPPAKGDNDWTLQILGADDQPVDSASIKVTPFMPDHGHGTPIKAQVTDQGDGMYDLDPVNLWMPGLWEVTLDLTTNADETATVVYRFCIEG